MYSNQDYLTELLVERGLVTPEGLEEIRGTLGPNDSIINRLILDAVITEEQIGQVIAANSGNDYVEIENLPILPEVFNAMEAEVAQRFHAVPIGDDGTYVTVAVADALDFETLDSLPHVIGREVIFAVSTPTAIARLLKASYGVEDDAADSVDEFKVIGEGGEEEVAESGDAPIIKMVTNMLLDAFKMRASDIHIEPLETSLRVRFRIDGKLVEVDNHPKRLIPAIVARVKVMSGSMSIAEKRMPQDGRIQMRIGGKEVDLRVSTVPSNHGESIVMRILDKSSLLLGLGQLGFYSDDQETFERLMELPDGIILVTGPTGSGKTTTLYACLNHINKNPQGRSRRFSRPVHYQLC